MLKNLLQSLLRWQDRSRQNPTLLAQVIERYIALPGQPVAH